MSERPEGWVETTLGELGEYVNGRGFKQSEWSDTGRPIIRIQNLTGSSDKLNYFQGEVEQRHVVETGDLLVSWAATLGVFVWKGPEAVLNQHIFKVRSFVDVKFHRYLLENVLADLQRQTHGSGMVHITKGRFDQTPIELPPLHEQERIVAAIEEQFSRLDAAEESLHRARRNVERFRAGAFSIAAAGVWPMVPLGEIADVVGGITKDTKRQSDPGLVEVPYLRVANVQRGYLDLTEISRIRVTPEKAKALALQPGDVLFNEGGDRDKLGRGWVWNGEIAGCIHQNHVFRARLHEGFDPRFVSWHGNTFGRRWFEENGKQTTNLASLNLRTLKSFPVPAPSLPEQQEVVAEVERQLSIIDAVSAAIYSALARSAQLRRSILDRAFRGTLVPQDPLDEPASVLLDRIKGGRPGDQKRRRSAGRF